MCGIAGLIGLSGQRPDPSAIKGLAERIAHRGPDARGFCGWSGGELTRSHHAEELEGSQVQLAHLRLSIIDVSEDGWQPMATEDGSHAIVFNGEIYNFIELRAELEALGWRFTSHSDTEVLLKAWIQWGEAILPKLVGMFAFAILDCKARRLFVARDPFGIKPFYWTQTEDVFAFASELQALSGLNGVDRRVCPQAVYDFLRFAITDENDRTLLSNIFRLPAGHWASIDIDRPVVEPVRFWSIDHTERADISFEDAAARMREMFLNSVRLHMRSDVPVGAALSGGIDSSSIVMAMRHLGGSAQDIHAFSFVADDAAISEERWIDLAGAASGATVHKLRLSPEQLAGSLDSIVAAQGEPFGSTSIAAQYHVYGLARSKGIKVTMDGQGADEMLAGYPVFFAARLASLLKSGRIGEGVAFARRASQRTGYPLLGLLLRSGRWLLPQALHAPARHLIGEATDPRWLAAKWLQDRGAVLAERLPALTGDVLHSALYDTFSRCSLPALLRFGDRNSMAHSVESRVPFLTPDLVRFAFSLPENYLIAADGTTKAVFRAAMRGIVPDSILDRTDKIGFSTPEKRWLVAISPWVEEILNSDAAKRIPVINQSVLIDEWQKAKAGGGGWGAPLWRCVNLILWTERVGASFAF